MAKRRSYVNVGGGGHPRANWWKQTIGTDYYQGTQQGGGEQATAPSPLVGAALSTTQISLWWIGTGADSYTLQRSTSADYSGATDISTDSSKTLADTGRTANTTYYYRVKAVKAGLSDSDWVTFSCKTLSVVPLHAYDFRGIDRGTTNAYGKTTISSVDEVYSYRGTANTLTPTTGTKGVIQTQDAVNSINRQSAYTRVSLNNLYTPASNINLGTGNFTILIELGKNGLAGLYKNILSLSTDANTYLQINNANARFRLIAAIDYVIPFPSALTSVSKQRLIIKRVGTTCSAGLMAEDGSVSFGSPVTNANLGNVATFDRIGAAEQLWYFNILNFYPTELTNAQIQEEFRRGVQPDYAFTSLNKTLFPKGISAWSDLSSGYFIDANTGANASANGSWDQLYTIGGHSLLRLVKKDALQQDFLKIFRHADAKISNDILMGYPGSIDGGGHNVGSPFPLDNTYYFGEYDIHSAQGVPTNLVIKRFGTDFDMSEYTQLQSLSSIASHRASFGQYPQIIKTANYTHVIVQEWDGNSAPWIVDYRFKDNLNSCEKTRLVDASATANWFYKSTIYSEDDVIRIVIEYLLIGATDRYLYSAYLETDDDFNTVHNLMYGFDSGNAAAFSRSISNNESPLSLSELTTHFLMTHDGTLDAHNCKVTTAYFDPTDSKVYGCGFNGSNNGLNFIHGVNGQFLEVAIDLHGHTIVCSTGEDIGAQDGSNMPTIVRTGVNSYRLFCQEIVSGAIWKVVEFSTTDSWATSTFVGDVTDDDTKNHDRISVTKNIHHTGGVDAYNEKRLLACSREQTSPDIHSDTFFYDISQ